MAIDNEDGDDLNAFEQAKADARVQYGKLDMTGLAKAYLSARDGRDKLKGRLAVANAHFDVLRFELIPQHMDKEGIDSVTLDGIGRVGLTGDAFVTMKPGMKEKLFAWFKKNKLADMIVPQINASTLKAFVMARMKMGKSIPSEYLNVTPVTRASVTKTSK